MIKPEYNPLIIPLKMPVIIDEIKPLIIYAPLLHVACALANPLH